MRLSGISNVNKVSIHFVLNRIHSPGVYETSMTSRRAQCVMVVQTFMNFKFFARHLFSTFMLWWWLEKTFIFNERLEILVSNLLYWHFTVFALLIKKITERFEANLWLEKRFCWIKSSLSRTIYQGYFIDLTRKLSPKHYLYVSRKYNFRIFVANFLLLLTSKQPH